MSFNKIYNIAALIMFTLISVLISVSNMPLKMFCKVTQVSNFEKHTDNCGEGSCTKGT